LTDGYNFATATFTNFSEEVLSVNEIYITRVSASRAISKAQPIFPGNITIGATREDVIAVHGEPSQRTAFNTFQHFVEYMLVQIRFSEQTNEVVSIVMDYWGWYRKPTAIETESETMGAELSDTLNGAMFSLNGVVYTLPVPFSELEADGFTFFDPSDRTILYYFVPGRNFPDIEFISDNHNIGARLSNLTRNAFRPYNESYVVEVYSIYGKHNAQLLFPGNIMVGSAYENVIATYGEPSSRHTSEDSTFFRLFYVSEQFILEISIDVETSLISAISMQHWNPVEPTYTPVPTPALDISHIPFFGNHDNFRLSAEQALAFAEAIKLAEIDCESWGHFDFDVFYPVLIDVFGDGIPLLLLVYRIPNNCYVVTFCQ